MVWERIDPPPTVPSLENYTPEYAKRFTSICITHLIMHRQNWIKKKMEELGIRTARDAIEFGIREVDYPFYMGQPDDLHTVNFYHGKNCWKITEDYWDTCYEVMMEVVLCRRTGCRPLADCDGSSIFITGMLRILDVPAYEIFGAVYKGNKLLGGHAYTITKLEDNKWHLIETTLDTPPSYPDGYPTVNPNENRWSVGDLVYEGWIKFNEKEYWEWKSSSENMLEKYAKMKLKEKETYGKHRAIEEAYRIRSKALKHRKLLGRLRWR